MSIILFFGLLPGWLQVILLVAILAAILDGIARLVRRAAKSRPFGRGASKD